MDPALELLVCDVDINSQDFILEAIKMFDATILEFKTIYNE